MPISDIPADWSAPGFLTPLRVESAGDNLWIIYEPLVYDSFAAQARIIVPKGLYLDFASVPRWLPIAYATTGGTANAAAALHDHPYGTHDTTTAVADNVFLEAMVLLGEPAWRRQAMYQAVNWFGGGSYKSGPARRRVLNGLG